MNKAMICTPQNATRKYETLRANALGDINRATGFTFFLQNGMSAWFYALQEQSFDHLKTQKETSPILVEQDVNIQEVGIVSILVDVTLQSIGTVDCRR
jgi:hypothetical protein